MSYINVIFLDTSTLDATGNFCHSKLLSQVSTMLEDIVGEARSVGNVQKRKKNQFPGSYQLIWRTQLRARLRPVLLRWVLGKERAAQGRSHPQRATCLGLASAASGKTSTNREPSTRRGDWSASEPTRKRKGGKVPSRLSSSTYDFWRLWSIINASLLIGTSHTGIWCVPSTNISNVYRRSFPSTLLFYPRLRY